jgi:hypothetical protein
VPILNDEKPLIRFWVQGRSTSALVTTATTATTTTEKCVRVEEEESTRGGEAYIHYITLYPEPEDNVKWNGIMEPPCSHALFHVVSSRDVVLCNLTHKRM